MSRPAVKPERGAIAQRHCQIDADVAGAARRFEAREVRAEVARDQRRARSRNASTWSSAPIVVVCSVKSPLPQIGDTGAQIVRAVAERAAAAVGRKAAY